AIKSVLSPPKVDIISSKAQRLLFGQAEIMNSKARRLFGKEAVAKASAANMASENQLTEHMETIKDSGFNMNTPVPRNMVIKEGFLDKKGQKRGGFKNRFFQLVKIHQGFGVPCITYCIPKLARSAQCIAIIPLVESSCIVVPHPSKDTEFALIVPGRRYELKALNSRERDEWVVVLAQVLRHKVSLTIPQSRELEIPRTKPFSLSTQERQPTMKRVLEGFLDKRKQGRGLGTFRNRFCRLWVDTGDKPMGSISYTTDYR
ncbi:hypothetical protein AAMO2058_000597200, partial [Amorphochlora amoebiformis]